MSEHAETAADATEHGQDVETLAKNMGWRPKEEFSGDPNRFVSAEDFVSKSMQMMPVMRRDLMKMSRQLSSTEERNAEMARVLQDMRDKSNRAEERAYERARRELEAERDQAIDSADRHAVRSIDQRLAELEKDRTPPKQEEKSAKSERKPNQPDPAVVEIAQRFAAQTPWYTTDPVLHKFVNSLHGSTWDGSPESLEENLHDVVEKTKAAFPDKFPAAKKTARGEEEEEDEPQLARVENPRRAQAAAVASGSVAQLNRGKSFGWDAIPLGERNAAKVAYERWKKQMPEYTVAEYVKLYLEQQ